MMSGLILPSRRKLLAASAASVPKPQNVFKTSLYKLTAGTPSHIVTGLDMVGNGGLVWEKKRVLTSAYLFVDTDRGPNIYVSSSSSIAENKNSNYVPAFYSDGYAASVYYALDTVGWSFLKSSGFFDIVLYTGDGVLGRQIEHGLGVTPGMIIVKGRDQVVNWVVNHREIGSTDCLRFNDAYQAATDATVFNDAATSSYFQIGNNSVINASGKRFVAYVFAQNPELIDCGSYIGNGSVAGPVVTCGSGWKPQWLMIKCAVGGGGDWVIQDNQRSPANPRNAMLVANSANPESSSPNFNTDFTSAGFQLKTLYTNLNESGSKYIYMAIREEY